MSIRNFFGKLSKKRLCAGKMVSQNEVNIRFAKVCDKGRCEIYNEAHTWPKNRDCRLEARLIRVNYIHDVPEMMSKRDKE